MEAFLDDPEYTTPVNKKSTSPFPRIPRLTHPSHHVTEGKKGKGKQTTGNDYVDAALQAQWAKDRAKKAAHKQARQTVRLLAALDPLNIDTDPTRASRKAMRAVSRLDLETTLSIAPRAVVDVGSLEAQMRRFVEGGRYSVALPPMDKAMRKTVHEMAAAFGVKSVSKGKGQGRYTTLIRTSRTGVGVKEGKVRAVVERFGKGRGREGKGKGKGGKGGRGGDGMPRHREGDEVGKEAPKIGESNIGFRMLASMGWSEGDRIGGTGSVGIEAPLTAIIKNSKLGLGATR